MENVLWPVQQLNQFSKSLPEIWKAVDEARYEKEMKIKHWPDWCFLPIDSCHAIVKKTVEKQFRNVDFSSLDYSKSAAISDYNFNMACELASIGVWRYTQGIYRFDQEFVEELFNTELKGDMPADVLLRLPEWCMYVETPGLALNGVLTNGFWVHLDSDINATPIIRFLINIGERNVPFLIPLGPWSLEEAIQKGCSEFSSKFKSTDKANLIGSTVDTKEMSTALAPLLSMVLYLCSNEPEIKNRYPGSTFQRPQAKKTKKGWRLFPPDKPTVYQIGYEIGKTLREARSSYNYQGQGHKPPRVHVRRAHWHGYWLGSENNKRYIYKWLSPMIINGRVDESSEAEINTSD